MKRIAGICFLNPENPISVRMCGFRTEESPMQSDRGSTLLPGSSGLFFDVGAWKGHWFRHSYLRVGWQKWHHAASGTCQKDREYPMTEVMIFVVESLLWSLALVERYRHNATNGGEDDNDTIAGCPAQVGGADAEMGGGLLSVSVAESYQLCCAAAQRAGTNFYVSFRALPLAKRQAICAVYAFMRRSDDIADGAANPALASEGLRRWRTQVEAVLGRGTGGLPVSAGVRPNGQDAGSTVEPMLIALADTVQRYKIPGCHFQAVLEGTEMDQRITRFETFADLYPYCYRVASCVGLIVLPIFGYQDAAALVPAEACGIAFQLTNILRDVAEDARLGRIYLPREDLRRFGVTEEEIMNQCATPRFVELMKFEAVRAREYYQKAAPLLGMISPDSRVTLAVMIGVYAGLLDKIARRNYAVLDGRVRLNGLEKATIAARNWWRYRG